MTTYTVSEDSEFAGRIRVARRGVAWRGVASRRIRNHQSYTIYSKSIDMRQQARVTVVAVFVVVAAMALGVQAMTIDRGQVVQVDNGSQIQTGNTLVGVQSWGTDGRLVEISPAGDLVWEYQVEDARVFGVDPLRKGDLAPNITPAADGNVVLFAIAEKHPAEDCPAEFTQYEYELSGTDNAQDHCVRNRVVLMDRANTQIVWEYSWYDQMIHWHEVHDAIVTDDGDVAIIDMGNDRVFTVNQDGEVTWEWQAEDNIDRGTEFFAEYVQNNAYVDNPSEYAKQGPLDDWTHWNDIDETAEGNFQLSVRNFDMIIEVDPDTGAIVDTTGQPGRTDLIHRQHNPQLLEESGSIVVADSENDRVVEIDSDDEQLEWVYSGPQGDSLQWPRDADRMPNGNTLITDSRNNRILEVNASGNVVWEFSDPDGAVIPLPYTAERLPGGETAGGPSTSQFEVTQPIEQEQGALVDLRRIETLAHWLLPTWMHLPQQLNLVGIVLGVLWLGGEGTAHAVSRLHIRERLQNR